ncbi:MAG TPA: tripartite tricarboxylate transporter substrate binding protein [Eoetvoesiella sp.]
MSKLFQTSICTAVLSALAAIGPSATAKAQEAFPSKPIRLISCCAGTVDSLARMLGEHISQETKQPVIVETKAGAAGIIAASYVMKEKADGYTVLIGTGQHGANELLYEKVPYNYATDFTPITGVVTNPTGLFVNAASPYNNINDLVAAAKKQPGVLTSGWGSTTSRIGSELFKQLTGADILTVGYKTNPQVTIDLIGDRITMTMGDIPTNLQHVRSGKLRALAVSTSSRLAQAPDIPTLEEAGVKGYDNFGSWIAAWAPAGTPKDTVKTLNGLFERALTSEMARNYFSTTGMLPFVTTSEGLERYQKAEHNRWARIIKAAGMTKG